MSIPSGSVQHLLELLEHGGSDNALLCLSVFNELQTEPTDSFDFSDYDEPSTMSHTSIGVQSEPHQKEELLFQLKNLELERKKLEIQNLIDEQTKKERTRQVQEQSLLELNRGVQQKLM